MTQKGRSGGTVNRGSIPKPNGKRDEFDVTGNARRRGEDPSPDDRQRGETSRRDQDTSARKPR